MQYLLTEEEYIEFESRPVKKDNDRLLNRLREMIMHKANLSFDNCGEGYCDDCPLSGLMNTEWERKHFNDRYVLVRLCPCNEKSNFSK